MSAGPQGAVVPAGASSWRTGCISCTAIGRTWCRWSARRSGSACTASSRRWPNTGPTRGPQHVFVNRRIVKDKTIAHAIFDAYSVASNKERSPEVHLFLEIPPDRIDVNVHPTKAEVRFQEQSLVHEIVRRAVADALGRGPAPELTLRPSDLIPGRPIAQSIPGVLGGGSYPNRWAQVPTASYVPPRDAAEAAAPDVSATEAARHRAGRTDGRRSLPSSRGRSSRARTRCAR